MDYRYIVRFVRADGKADEEYFYHRELEARYHLELFRDDDSGLYRYIELCSYDKPEEAIETIFFE